MTEIVFSQDYQSNFRLFQVYLIMAGVIVALGVMNTAMSSACARLADADEVSLIII